MNTLLREYMGAEEFETPAVVDEIVLPTTVEEIAVQAAAAEVSEVSGDVQEQGEELQEVAKDVEELQEQVDELQEAVEGAESFLNRGNWNPEAFAMAYGQAEKLFVKLGGEVTSVVGAESLSDATTARLAAQTGLEAFGARAKQIGGSALAFIKRIWDNIISFIAGLFNTSKRLRTLAAKVKAHLETKDLKAKEQIKLGKWNAYVNVEKAGRGVDVDVIVDASIATAGLADAADSLAKAPENASVVKTALDKVGASLGKLGGQASGLKKADKNGVGSAFGLIEGIEVHYSHYTGEVKDVKDLPKALKATRATFKVAAGEGVKTKGEVKNPLTVDGAKKLVSEAVDGLDKLARAKIESKFSTASRDRTIGLLKTLEGKEEAGAAITAVKSAYATVGALTSTFNRLAINTIEAKIDAARAAV